MDSGVVTVAFGIALGFAVLAALLGLNTFVRRVLHRSHSERRANAWAGVQDHIAAAVADDRQAVASIERLLRRHRTRGTAVSALADAARGDSQTAMALGVRFGDAKYLHRWVNRRLSHPDPGRRVEAAEVAGTLHLRRCRGSVAVATRDADPEVRVMACRALAVLDPESAIGILLRLVETDGAWAGELLGDVVQRSSAHASRALVDRAHGWSASPGLLKAIAAAPTAGAEDVLTRALSASDHTSRSLAVAGLAETRAVGSGIALVDLLIDERETVRLAAVRALGRLDDPDRALDLASALSDASRLVRFAAANALVRTESGRYVLMKVARGHEESAAEAAHLALWQYYEQDDDDARPDDGQAHLVVVPSTTSA
jgi:HEAT repeat protein